MVNLGDVLKDLYRSDSVDKNLILDFFYPGETEPFLHLSGTGNIMSETMEIEESLSSNKNIEFGSCEASQFKITLVDVWEDLKDSYVTVYQTLEGLYPSGNLYPAEDLYPSGYTMPLGRYVVRSADKQANRKYRELVALDFMSRFDINVIDWYNALKFPMTLRAFRASLCRYVGVTEEVPNYLPNDGMMIEKTIDTAELMGRAVLIACEQANGVFGHFDRAGVLQHVALQPNSCLVPALDLYPSEDLYPVSPGEVNTQVYDEQMDPHLIISCQFEEYTVKSIDTVQIRQEEGDIGAVYGEGANCYTVEGNFLLYGKGADELAVVARNIYGMVNGRTYIPFESQTKGLPYIETGDAVRFEFGEGYIVSYVIKRTLRGVYALKDSYSATGDETRRAESSVNTEIIQLKGKAAILKRNVEEASANLIDLGKNTEAKFAITAEQISAEAKRAKEAEASLQLRADSITTSVKDLKTDTESQFRQLANDISAKVSRGDLLSSLQLAIDEEGAFIKMATGHFIFEGQNFYVNKDGSGGAANGNFTWDADGNIHIKGAEISGAMVSGTNSASVMSCNTIGIVSADIDRAYIDYLSGGAIYANDFYGDFHGELNPFSDARLKQNIVDIDHDTAAGIIKELRPVAFEYKKNSQASMGFIAQEVKEICDHCGLQLPLYGRCDEYYTIPYLNYIPLMVAAIQELLDDLEERREHARDI